MMSDLSLVSVPRPAHRWVASCLLVAGLALAPSVRGEPEPPRSAEVAGLEARVERLEAMVAELRALLASSASLGHSDLAPVADPAPHTPAHGESIARDVVDSEVPLKRAYWPSRGWNASWQESFGSPIEMRAYLDLEYIDAGRDGSRDGVSTFDNHHVQVFLDSQLTPRVGAHIELEWEHAGDTVEVDSAFLEIDLTSALRVDVGRFYTPFGIERFVGYSPTNAIVSRPDLFRQVVPNNFYADGVELSGAHGVGTVGVFAWELALSNGLGSEVLTSRRSSRQTRDNNSNKAFTGRLAYVHGPRFEIGGSLHQQRYDDEASGVGDLDLTFRGLDLAWRWNGFELRSEAVWSEIDRPDGDELRERGWYGQLAYLASRESRWFPAILFAGRVEQIDFDTDLPGEELDLLALGLNLTVIDHVRLKAEHQWRDESIDLDSDRWLFQMVVDF